MRSRSKYLFVVCCLLFLATLFTLYWTYSFKCRFLRVHSGMSESAVVSLLGEPEYSQSGFMRDPDGKLNNEPLVSLSWARWNTIYTVHLHSSDRTVKDTDQFYHTKPKRLNLDSLKEYILSW